MKTFIHHFPATARAIAAGLLVAACGGGGSSAPSSSTATAGFVVDGYVAGANVVCDRNADGALSADEIAVVADSSGFFRFSEGCNAGLVATGGTHFGGLPFTSKLMAPAGSTVITPLTTLLTLGMSQAEVNTTMGLLPSTDLRNTDPARLSGGLLVNGTLYKRTLAFQQVAHQLTEAFAALAPSTGAAARPAIYAQVLAAFVTALGNGDVLIAGSDVNATVLSKLVKAATLRVAGSSDLSSEVRNAAAGLNADTMAQVLTGGLNAQADALASAADTGLVALATALQANALIRDAVVANGGTLSAPPSPASETLKNTLTAQVDASLANGTSSPPPAGPTPPPPATGDTLLLDFDTLLPTDAFGGEGGEGSGIVAAPAGGSGDAYRVLRSGGQPYALAVIEKAIPLTATRKTLVARVYSPTAGIPIVIKLEGAGGVNTGEVQANEAVVAGWQTLSWTFSAANPATSYNKIVLLPNLGTVDAPPGKSYVFDNFALKADAAAPAPAPGTGSPPAPAPSTGADTVLLNFDNLLPISASGGEGGEGSGLVDAPAGGGSGQAYRVLRSGGQAWALSVIETALPLTNERKTLTAQVHSPTAGIPMVIKLEGAAGINSGEVQSNEAVVAGWQTLSWTFSTLGAYNKIVLLPNLGTVDAPPGKSYVFDNISLKAAATGNGSGGGGTGGGANTLPITFDAAGVAYTLTGFEGATGEGTAADPAGGNNRVGKVTRAPGGPWYGGATVSTGPNNSVATIPFAVGATTMSMRFYSPGPGVVVRMKVENANDVTITSETDATTVGTGWERLTFNFNNPGLAPPVTGGPTAALNVAQTYNKVTVFFNVAAAGGAWGGTYYFDDIAFGTP